MKTKRPQISLCMIVRDEERMLPGFLTRVDGLWDELCVVDTGSQDGTVALLAQAGARVRKVEWKDDFAAARNASLEMARGEWVLFLDPDEYVSPELVKQIRAMCSRDLKAGAATVRMHNALPSGHERVSSLLRLFRREDGIKFRFPIHEEVTSSVEAMLERRGLLMRHLSGRVQHLGYVRERAAQKNKRARDGALLARCLAEDPDDSYSHFKRLELARFWGDRELWEKAAQEALQMLFRRGTGWLRQAHFGGELVVLVADGLFPHAPREALDCLRTWSTQVPASAAASLREGELRETLGDAAGARVAFERALGLDRNGLGDLQLTRVRPQLGLMRLALARGQLTEALRLTEAALVYAPLDAEALLARTTLARGTAGAEGVEVFCQAHRQTHGRTVELDQALAEEALLTRDAPRAVAQLRALSAASRSSALELKLAQAELAAGEVESCRRRLMDLAKDVPAALLGVVLCDLAQGRNSDVEIDVTEDEAEVALKDWLDVLRRASPAWSSWRQVVARTLAPMFPWLPRYVGHLEVAAG